MPVSVAQILMASMFKSDGEIYIPYNRAKYIYILVDLKKMSLMFFRPCEERKVESRMHRILYKLFCFLFTFNCCCEDLTRTTSSQKTRDGLPERIRLHLWLKCPHQVGYICFGAKNKVNDTIPQKNWTSVLLILGGSMFLKTRLYSGPVHYACHPKAFKFSSTSGT